MRVLHCKDAGFDCDGEFTGETDQEVLEQAAAHAREKHPDLTLDDATVAKLQTLIHEH